MKNKTYIVGYDHEHYNFKEVFSTDDKDIADRWCKKFDKILSSYKEFLSQFEISDEDNNKSFDFEREDLFIKWYIRWSNIFYINGSAIYEIEKR